MAMLVLGRVIPKPELGGFGEGFPYVKAPFGVKYNLPRIIGLKLARFMERNI